jgi:PKD repeat protein
VVAGIALGLPAAAQTAAIVVAPPTFPVPAGAPAGPPPISVLPAATTTQPPADQISDPVTAGASCGGWYLQSNYGDRWPATSTWWEYQCTYQTAQYYPHPCPTVGACDAVCYGYPIDCYTVSQSWTDYFYWDGSSANFYGELYASSIDDGMGYSASSTDWWDGLGQTKQWYDLGPFTLTVSRAGNGSGQVSSSPAGIDCGPSCQTSFDPGTTLTLTATTTDPSSVFMGWSGDCSGTGSCQVTMNQDRSVTATFALKTHLSVYNPGFGSGQVTSNPAGINCGPSCQAAFTPGTIVSLRATPDAGSNFIGWSDACSGTGSCQVTMDQNRNVGAVFALNTLPHASFTVACTGLACSFDGSGSTDANGTVATYAWSFGDGSAGSGKTISHTYARAGGYTVTLTVTDNAGATNSASTVVSPISLTARGYTANGLEKAALSWTGPSGSTSFDVYRNSTKLATVPTTTYTDTIGSLPGTYHYKVCASASTICSNQVTITFSQDG